MADSLPIGETGQGGDDPVQRRRLLSGVAGLAIGPMLAGAPSTARANNPARRLARELERVLLHGQPVGPDLEPAAFPAGLAAVRADFQASRYSALAERLPRLLSALDRADVDPSVGAELYNTAVHVCIKLRAPGLDWLAADRALTAARACGDPVVEASVLRNVSTLLRNAGKYDDAQQIALHAADRLPVSSPAASVDPATRARNLSLYGALVCTAGYAAAQGGDRPRCNELLGIAADTANRLGADRNDHWTPFGPNTVRLYWVSAAWRLGDAGTAIEHARQVRLDALQLPERQSRYWIDVARAFQQWGKPTKAYRALRIADAVAPEEVRAQPKVGALTRALLAAPTTGAMPELRRFAAKLGIE